MARWLPIEQRFWGNVERRGPDQCWVWKGHHNGKGYGRIRHNGKAHPAQRMAWELTHGRRFPAGMFACHSCDNSMCVNPAHIWPGTAADNANDRKAKGRTFSGQQRGHYCPSCGTRMRVEWLKTNSHEGVSA